jgi:hypothetical protein
MVGLMSVESRLNGEIGVMGVIGLRGVMGESGEEIVDVDVGVVGIDSQPSPRLNFTLAFATISWRYRDAFGDRVLASKSVRLYGFDFGVVHFIGADVERLRDVSCGTLGEVGLDDRVRVEDERLGDIARRKNGDTGVLGVCGVRGGRVGVCGGGGEEVNGSAMSLRTTMSVRWRCFRSSLEEI